MTHPGPWPGCGYHDGAPQTTHDIWEIWAAGASPAGGSSSPGHLAAAVQRGYRDWGPPIHNMGRCSRPGEDPNAWKQFGPEPTRAIEPRHRPPGQQWILGEGLRRGSGAYGATAPITAISAAGMLAWCAFATGKDSVVIALLSVVSLRLGNSMPASVRRFVPAIATSAVLTSLGVQALGAARGQLTIDALRASLDIEAVHLEIRKIAYQSTIFTNGYFFQPGTRKHVNVLDT